MSPSNPLRPPPPTRGRCGFSGAMGQCQNPGRWDRDGILCCTTHRLARNPTPFPNAESADVSVLSGSVPSYLDGLPVDRDGLERDFHRAMLGIYESARRLRPPYVPSAFLSLVTELGGKRAADQLLAPGQPSSGFTELYLRGKESLALSVEFLALQAPWRDLFSPEQLATARRRLEEVGFELPPAEEQVSAPEPFVLPDEVTFIEQLTEGSVSTVTVNAYERNPVARARCIQHYGPTCVICGFNFGQAFGPDAAGYIHVHHIRPLSSIGAQYVVDPIEDLRPVCPNCHAVIHLGGECRGIEEVRAMIANSRSSA